MRFKINDHFYVVIDILHKFTRLKHIFKLQFVFFWQLSCLKSKNSKIKPINYTSSETYGKTKPPSSVPELETNKNYKHLQFLEYKEE